MTTRLRLITTALIGFVIGDAINSMQLHPRTSAFTIIVLLIQLGWMLYESPPDKEDSEEIE
jgi:hypothetical protein